MRKLNVITAALIATTISAGANAGIIDIGINTNQAQVNANTAGLKAETAARVEGDKALGGRIDGLQAAGAAAYGELKGQIGQQQTQINAVQDAAQQANVKGDANAVRLDGVEKNLGAVQGAAQTANDRATALEGRADAAEGAIRDTNSSLAGAVASQNGINSQVQGQISATNGAVKAVDTKVDANKAAQDKVNATQAHTNVQLQSGINTAQFTADVAYNNSVTNDKNIRTVATVVDAQGKVIANHETRITSTEKTVANHETRIGNTEKVNARQDVTLNEHTAALKRNDQQWTAQGQLNNEYGQRLDSQEAMSSRFAADLGNIKSEVAGMNDRINSADRKAEKALNAAAGALSVASIQFNTDVEAGFQVGAGVATLAGKNAAAVGVGGAINKNWFVSGYATQAGSASGGAVSATYSFGR